MGTMEDQIRKAVREEIARALGAVGAVADGASQATGEPIDIARGVIANVMERVARDVLANVHPALEPEHTASTAACTCSCRACFGCTEDEHTASTQPVHTITTVPERSRAACTCHRHTHVMGHDDRCGAPFCYCLSPVRARAEHTDEHANACPCTVESNRPLNPISPHLCSCGHYQHAAGECTEPSRLYVEHASTEAPRTCSVCSHGEHDQGKCTMHVYLRGVASPCPCLASRTLGAQASTRPNPMCTVCEHAPHGAGNCGAVEWPATAPCECGGRS